MVGCSRVAGCLVAGDSDGVHTSEAGVALAIELLHFMQVLELSGATLPTEPEASELQEETTDTEPKAENQPSE